MVPKAKSDEYAFFDHMDIGPIYKAVKYANNDSPLETTFGNKTLVECDNKSLNSSDIKVCKKFNKLIKELCAIKSSSHDNNSLKNSDYDYLKFWINLALKEEGIFGNATMDEFSATMKDEYRECFRKDEMKYIFNIIENDFEKMKILDNLYKNYFEIEQIIFSNCVTEIEKCSSYSKQCVKDYIAAISEYQNTKDHFYNALKNFENKHKNLHNQAFGRNKSFAAYIEMIPKAYQISDLTSYTMDDENNKIILISLLGSASAIILILIYFYMFTPCCARMRYVKGNRKKIFHNEDDNTNNSLQYLANSINVGFNNKKYNLAYQTA